jgi:hypothetical protein
MARLGNKQQRNGRGGPTQRDRGEGGGLKDTVKDITEHEGLKPISDQTQIGPITLGGEGINPYEPVDLMPWDDVIREFDPKLTTGLEIVEVSKSECEICMKFDQRLLGMNMQVPLVVCWQYNDKCNEIGRPEENPLPPPPELPPPEEPLPPPAPTPSLDPTEIYLLILWYDTQGGYSGEGDLEIQIANSAKTGVLSSLEINENPQDYRTEFGTLVQGYGRFGFAFSTQHKARTFDKIHGTWTTTSSSCSINYEWYFRLPWNETENGLRSPPEGWRQLSYSYDGNPPYADCSSQVHTVVAKTGSGLWIQNYIDSWPASESAGIAGSIRRFVVRKVKDLLKSKPAIKDFPILDMRDCCSDNTALLRKIAKVLGVDRLHKKPAVLPRNLIQPGSTKNVELNDYVDMYEFLIRYIDRVLGKGPWEILVEDADPNTEGKQQLTLRFESIGEMLKNLVALEANATRSSGGGQEAESIVNIRTLFQLGLATLFETGITHKMVAEMRLMEEEIIEFLGFKASEMPSQIRTTFSPLSKALEYASTGSEDELRRVLPQLLRPDFTPIKYWQNQDDMTLYQMLEKINRAAQESRNVTASQFKTKADFDKAMKAVEFGMEVAQLIQLRQLNKTLGQMSKKELRDYVAEIEKRYTKGQSPISSDNLDKSFQQPLGNQPDIEVRDDVKTDK